LGGTFVKRLVSIILTALLLFGLFPTMSSAAIAQNDLDAFLTETSLSEDDLNFFLEYYYGESLEDFNTLDELKAILGDPITNENLQQIITDYEFADEQALVAFLVENGEMDENDLIQDVFRYVPALESTITFYKDNSGTPITEENLNNLLIEYDLTQDELNDLLAKNGDSLDNYEYIEDLDFAVSMYISGNDMNDLFSKLGMTDDELEAIMDYLMTLDLEDPAIVEKLDDLQNRLMAFTEFDSATDLTDTQITELGNIMEEMLNILQLDAKYYLVKGNQKTEISISQLIKMKDSNGSDLFIQLFDKNGDSLADLVITADLFGSEIIDETAKDIKKVEKVVKNPLLTKPRTIKGGKLPNTAGNYTEGILIGFILVGVGAFLLRKRTVK
jgi:processed acidic surface protein